MEESLTQVERINASIGELSDLNVSKRKLRAISGSWKSNHSILSTLLWSNEVKIHELTKREGKVRETVSRSLKIVESMEQELKELNCDRISRFSNRCDEIRKKGAKVAENFVLSFKEYSTENLTINASNFRSEFEAILEDLPAIGERFAELETLCGLEANDEATKVNFLVAKIAKIKNEKTEKINEATEILEKLQMQIKQQQTTLKNFQAN